MDRPSARSRFATAASWRHREAAPGELQPPGEIDVFTRREGLAEALNRFEGLSADGQVGAETEGEKSQLAGGCRDRIRCRAPVQATEVEHAGDQVGVGEGGHHRGEPTGTYHVVGIAEGQRPATGRTDSDVAGGTGPGSRGGIDQTETRVTFGPLFHAGTSTVPRAVVRHDNLPVAWHLLGREGLELQFDPGHAVQDRHHDADEGTVGRAMSACPADVLHALPVRYVEVLHVRC